jgi:hypothetical protein
MSIEVAEKVQKWFETQKFEFRLFPEQSVKKFQSLSQLCDFLTAEETFWKPIDEPVASKFRQIHHAISQVVTTKNDDSWISQTLNQPFNLLKNASPNFSNGQYVLFSETDFAKEYKKVVEKYGVKGDGGKAFLQGVLSSTVSTRHIGGWPIADFFGLFDAYVYKQLNERLNERIKNGETSLSEIQSKFNVFFGECDGQQSDRQKQFDEFCKAYLEWKQAAKIQFDEQAAKQLEEQQKHFDGEDTDWRKRIADLEDLYQNKLTLEAPVKHWEKLADDHNKKGHQFAKATATALIIMVIFLSIILFNWPPAVLETPQKDWDWNTLKGSFLLLSILSLAIYVVRFLAKFAISSYHLARDAEERKQLTYVYLSLLEKKAVTPEQQQIVLQALFSRADTGLLKGDHGPAMPSVVGRLVDQGG